MLSKRDIEVLKAIEDYTIEHCYPPSIREIGDAVNMKSTSQVHLSLVKLLNEGLIESDHGYQYARTIRVKGLRVIRDDTIH